MSNEDTIRTYFECLNHENWEMLPNVFHPEAVLRPVGAREKNGRDEIRGYFERVFSPWGTHVDEPTRILVFDDTAVAEVTFTGTPKGAETELSFDAVDVIDLEDGMIRRLTNWYDVTRVREMLTGAS